MKYAVVFILVFLSGFGILQFLDKEEVIASSKEENKPKEAPQLIDSLETSTPLEEDTAMNFSYQVVEGHYNVQWKDLAKVEFEDKLNDELKTMVAYPIFDPSVKYLDGQKIQIKGYVIPFEETGDATIVILSAFPFTSCFFCGGAGPETVMDVQMKKQNTKFKQDAMVTFRGKLRLNDSDLDYLNYILDEAEVFQE